MISKAKYHHCGKANRTSAKKRFLFTKLTDIHHKPAEENKSKKKNDLCYILGRTGQSGWGGVPAQAAACPPAPHPATRTLDGC